MTPTHHNPSPSLLLCVIRLSSIILIIMKRPPLLSLALLFILPINQQSGLGNLYCAWNYVDVVNSIIPTHLPIEHQTFRKSIPSFSKIKVILHLPNGGRSILRLAYLKRSLWDGCMGRLVPTWERSLAL